jgi:spore coat protein A, manganese oxidase
MPTMSLLNNLAYDDDHIERPSVDSVEQWNIINTTADTHSIHLHLVQFQLRNRQAFNTAAYLAAAYPNLGPDTAGTAPYPVPSADPYVTKSPVGPAANERGWKDTVRANPARSPASWSPSAPKRLPGCRSGSPSPGSTSGTATSSTTRTTR